MIEDARWLRRRTSARFWRATALSARTIDRLSDDACLFDNGLDSFGAVQVMMDLEEHFGIEFPEHLLNRDAFSSVRNIRDFVSGQTMRKAA